MNNSGERIVNFLKKNAVYFVLAFCVLAIGLSIMFAVISENNKLTANNPPVNEGGNTETPDDNHGDDTPNENPDDNPTDTPSDDKPVVTEIKFIMPVANATSVGDFATMVFNSTLSRFESHKALDFYADEGTPVFAVYGGTVESVTNSVLKGYTVTIDHGNGLKTVYNSLAEGVVTEGQQVSQGDVIGAVSTTNRQEYKSGAHLHFEVIENGETINPEKYLELENK